MFCLLSIDAILAAQFCSIGVIMKRNREESQSNEDALFAAARTNDLNALRYFAKKIDINTRDPINGYTALHYAAINGHTTAIRLLVEDLNANINMQDINGYTPLHYMVSYGDIEIVKLFAELNANLNVIDNIGATPLYHAILNNDIEMVEILKSLGAKINVQNNYNNTPLHYAVIQNDIEMMKKLASFGANVNVQDIYGDTVLNHAIIQSDIEMMATILASSLDRTMINVRNNEGMTSLHHAANGGHIEIVRLLVKDFNAKVNAQDNYGRNPLHYAAREDHLEIVRFLVKDFNTNVNVQDIYGYTPLDYADALKSCSEIKAILTTALQAPELVRRHEPENTFLPQQQQARERLNTALCTDEDHRDNKSVFRFR